MRYITVVEETDTEIEVSSKMGSDIYGVIVDVLDLVRNYRKSVKFVLNNVFATADIADTSATVFDKYNEAYKSRALASIEIAREHRKNQLQT